MSSLPEGFLAMPPTEVDSCREFDELAQKSGMFRSIYSEVSGHYLWNKLHANRQACRIDRIVFPSKTLIDAGWHFGPIGVEIKSPEKGVRQKAVEQCNDYRNAVFEILQGHWVYLEFIAIYPGPSCAMDNRAIFPHSCIGSSWTDKWKRLNFKFSDSLITFTDNNVSKIGTDYGLLYVQRQIWAGAKDGNTPALLECLKLEQPELVKESVNYQTLSIYVRDLTDGGDKPLPESLASVVDVKEVFSLRLRKA